MTQRSLRISSFARRHIMLPLHSLNEQLNPYVKLKQLQCQVARLDEQLEHASCVCGRRLGLDSAYGYVACECCQQLAVIARDHDCALYLGEGVYWCRRCVTQAVYLLGMDDVLTDEEGNRIICETASLGLCDLDEMAVDALDSVSGVLRQRVKEASIGWCAWCQQVAKDVVVTVRAHGVAREHACEPCLKRREAQMIQDIRI